MFKLLSDLFRGKASEAAAALAERNALTLLDQQLRDTGSAIQAAQRALAMALAQEVAETRRLDAAMARIRELEHRACAALAGGREDLALLAADTIAELEMDRDSAAQARALLAAEISRLRAQVGEAARRCAELQRGRHLAQLSEAVRQARLTGFNAGPISAAQATLAALRDRQLNEQAAATALDDITQTPGRVEDRLADAGFGPARRPSAHDILARLRPLAIRTGE